MENILLFVIQRRPRFDEGVVVVVQSLDDDVRERESISARASKSKELRERLMDKWVTWN
jgi:hypothetical protein|tara:strand:+ start:415 stop:591 length:177 start_codon:yes stop_codon:yes gene_type:complete